MKRTATAKRETLTDQVRKYLAEARVVSNADLKRDLDPKAVNVIARFAELGEFQRQATGIYSVLGLTSDDPRVRAKIDETSAAPIARDVAARQAARTEARSAEQIKKRTNGPAAIATRVRAHFVKHPVALASHLRVEIGPNVGGALDALVKSGELMRVQDGLFARKGVDLLSPEFRRYAEEQGAEMETIRRELKEAMAFVAKPIEGEVVDYWPFTPEGPAGSNIKRPTRLYMKVPGMPQIYAAVKSRDKVKRVAWFPGKGVKLSAITCEAIARMVIDPMPETMRDLLQAHLEETLPLQAKKRNSGRWLHEADGWNRREPQLPPNRAPDPRPSYHAPIDNYQADRSHRRRQGYGPGDTVGLDPTRFSVPLRTPVTLMVDQREPDALRSRLVGIENVTLVPQVTLDVADYRAQDAEGRCLLIERKTTADLLASYASGRLADQVRAMCASGCDCLLIVEGGLYSSTDARLIQIAAMQSRLIVGVNIRIIETIDMTHTAYAIGIAIRDHWNGSADKFALRPKALPKVTPLETAKVMLETIGGISPTKAAALLDHFGSLARIAAADVQELTRVSGIGDSIAFRLHAVFAAGTARKD